jgi:hypothetical protein
MSKSIKQRQGEIREEIKRQRKPRKFNVEDLLTSAKTEVLNVDGVEVAVKTRVSNEDLFEARRILIEKGEHKIPYGGDKLLFLLGWRMLRAVNPDVTLERFMEMDVNWTAQFISTISPKLEESLRFLATRTPSKT